MNKPLKHFLSFQTDISSIALPKKFTFPFYYEPHLLCRIAVQELQSYLEEQQDWEHDFGLINSQSSGAIGKMFGVLIVKNTQEEIGYLAAFSGKLADSNEHTKFVPPIFDNLQKEDFYKVGERQLDKINKQVEVLERQPELLACQQVSVDLKTQAELELKEKKTQIKITKKARKIKREQAQLLEKEAAYQQVKETLAKESIIEQIQLKQLKEYWKQRLANQQRRLAAFQLPIQKLKEKRKQQSASLQQQLFESYHFLNQYGEIKNLLNIFEDTTHLVPPSGAGECAAPKLLQYAFQYQLTPIAMAEFWWGASPTSAIRKHGYFYPTCRGKCEPILLHMLKGIEMEENPMLTNPAEGKQLEIIYEDEHLVAVNKPAEFLSVPGKNIQDSVWLRMKQRYPNATGPLVVHRLDMSTSGILLIAKSKEVHKQLQRQFLERTIEKKYVALLDGQVEEKEGVINLPLRVDLDNRPHQLVCFKYGKVARTKWQVVAQNREQTLIHFFPITGRTHQLRVHAAHPLGLNAPIVGDDLYGNRKDRLYLHATWIAYTHPVTKARLEVEVKVDWLEDQFGSK